MRSLRTAISVAILAALSGCGPDYSPNTYSSTAVQQANKVEQGSIIGVRRVDVSAAAVVGTATGAAAGGIAGAQTAGGVGSAFGALGGALVGGLVGSAAEHATSDTAAYEYIVRKTGGELVSVTQKDAQPLPLGQKVLVIAGNQARIVPDYTLPSDASKPPDIKPPDAAPVVPGANATTATAPHPDAVGATPLPPPHATADAGRDPAAAGPIALVPPPLAAPVSPEIVPAVGARDTTATH